MIGLQSFFSPKSAPDLWWVNILCVAFVCSGVHLCKVYCRPNVIILQRLARIYGYYESIPAAIPSWRWKSIRKGLERGCQVGSGDERSRWSAGVRRRRRLWRRGDPLGPPGSPVSPAPLFAGAVSCNMAARPHAEPQLPPSSADSLPFFPTIWLARMWALTQSKQRWSKGWNREFWGGVS